MNNLFFVVCIVAIVFGSRVLVTYLKTRDTRQQQEQGVDLEETLAQINDLEERVRVIERIVTEKRFDLEREIERL